jgi:hypothetical protein
MTSILVSILLVAVLFVIFGWLRAADSAGGCSDCHHAGSSGCGTECPILKETLAELESERSR